MWGGGPPAGWPALWGLRPACVSSSLAVPKLREEAEVAALETWSFADWIVASKSLLSTHDAVAEGVVVDEAAGDEVLEDVLEHATSSITGTAAATTQRCIARFSPLGHTGGKWTGPRGGVALRYIPRREQPQYDPYLDRYGLMTCRTCI